jgi:hypothetical protein
MLICEVFSVDQHVSESELASLALQALRSEIRKSPSRKTFTIRRAHPAFDRVQFRLVTADEGVEANAWMDNDPLSAFITVCFRIPDDFEKAQAFIFSKGFETVFRHEFQHYLDKVGGKFDFTKSVDATKDRDGYYNSDIEYSAFFKEQAEPLLAILRAAKAGQSLDGLDRIEPDFGRFMRQGQHRELGSRDFPLKHFNAQTKRRYLRDMAALHKAVTAVSGATAPFRAKLLTRILHWVSEKTGIVI